MTNANEIAGQIEYYSPAMKAPRIREAASRLADHAREARCPGGLRATLLQETTFTL